MKISVSKEKNGCPHSCWLRRHPIFELYDWISTSVKTKNFTKLFLPVLLGRKSQKNGRKSCDTDPLRLKHCYIFLNYHNTKGIFTLKYFLQALFFHLARIKRCLAFSSKRLFPEIGDNFWLLVLFNIYLLLIIFGCLYCLTVIYYW